jgi:heat-inducible transcriptional repressor
LNERLVGLGLGARMLHTRLNEPSLSATEREFLDALSPVFTELEQSVEAALYVEGAGKLLTLGRIEDVSELNLLMDMLERRVALLEVLRSALTVSPDVSVRIGAENQVPALRSLALVAAGYGLPQRSLGTVSVIGPLRMDYGRAIRSVREAALQLSSYVADIYDERWERTK